MKMVFDGGIGLSFHGVKVTADKGLLAYRDLNDTLGMYYSISDESTEKSITDRFAVCS